MIESSESGTPTSIIYSISLTDNTVDGFREFDGDTTILLDATPEPASNESPFGRCLSKHFYPHFTPTGNLCFKQNPSYGTEAIGPGAEASEGPPKVLYYMQGTPEGRRHSVGLTPPPPAKYEYQHCHSSQAAAINKTARNRLVIASVLCALFMVAEVAGGVLSNSLAIATDAAHLLTDLTSFMISLFAMWVASRPATRRMSYGWYRAEVIGALTSVLLIWVVTAVLVYLAIQRIILETYEVEAEIMLITSGLGVGVNIIMGLVLMGQGHGHSHGAQGAQGGHGHSHGHGGGESPQQNINVRAAAIHVIGDFFQSIGVFTAALIIYFKPDWGIVDPICTFLFSLIVLLSTFAIIRDTLLVLMEAKPRGIDFEDVAKTFLDLPDVVMVHNLRIWALTLDKVAISAHVAIRPGAKSQTVLMEASKVMRDKYNFFEMTLQIEEFEERMGDCNKCKMPKH